MINKELKQKKLKRLLIDETINNIIEINNKLNDYAKYMEEDNFHNSKEVDKLYSEIKSLGYDLWAECR